MPRTKGSKTDPKAKANKVEAKKERFVRLGTARTIQVLKKIEVLSKCANRASYLFTANDIAKIFGAIEDAVETAKARFSVVPTEKEEQTFSL